MTTQDQIEWRRDQVIKLSSKGHSLTEISKILQVDLSTISRDVKHLREQARENIKVYLDEILPHEFEKAIKALEEVQKEAWLISSNAEDQKLKLQALTLAKDATVQKVDLLTNTETIDNAVSFVKDAQRKMEDPAKSTSSFVNLAGATPAEQEEEKTDDIRTPEEETPEPGQYNSTF